MLFSVLEQFEITKFSFSYFFSTFFSASEKGKKIISFVNKILLFISNKILFIRFRFGTLKRIIVKLFKIVQSFFFPNLFSTKNYMYSRIMSFCLKTYFKLFIKKKLILFIRCNSQVVKFKIQYTFQQAVETNFGHAYPYYSRLLNYYPYIFVTFFLIVCHNFNGLIFYGFTNTAFLLQNFVISFQAVVGLTLIGIFVRSYHFYKMFVPSNVPVVLLPFLVIIEIISHVAKIFSLAIRLFANMMSGHVLLHILTGFVLDLAKKNFLFIVFPIMLIMSIVVLEYGITLLQAYVFATLLAIYFEEHFGFSQEDQNKVSKLISVNGQKAFVVKSNSFLNSFMTSLMEIKEYYFIFPDRKRRKGRIKRKKMWPYAIHSIVFSKCTDSYALNLLKRSTK